MIFPQDRLFSLNELAVENSHVPRNILENEIRYGIVNGQIKEDCYGRTGDIKVKYYCISSLSDNKTLRRKIIDISKIDNNLSFEQKLLIENIFSKDIIKEILYKTEKDIKKIIETLGNEARTSLISDIYSTLLGKNMADIIRKKFEIKIETSGNDNRKSDLFFSEYSFKMELKATASKNSWSGGEYSKRPYPTILCSYDILESKYFVVMIPDIKWKNSKSNSYYATTLSWKDIRNDYPDKNILIGYIGQNNQMIRESL